jgi:magnesium-transporting ATPase (P-type)
LRLADVGVAMGRGGTEVARHAADLVLADDNFATLVEALVEGRGFWGNMRRSLGCLLGGNLAELALIAGSSVLGFPSPLNASQILTVNLLTDALPNLAVILQRPEHRDLAGLAREGTAALDAALRRDVLRRGVATALPTLAAFLWGQGTGSLERARALAFGTITVAELAQTLDVGWAEGRLSGSVLGAVSGSAAALAASLLVPGARTILGMAAPTPWGLGLVGLGGLSAVAINRLLRAAANRVPAAVTGS